MNAVNTALRDDVTSLNFVSEYVVAEDVSIPLDERYTGGIERQPAGDSSDPPEVFDIEKDKADSSTARAVRQEIFLRQYLIGLFELANEVDFEDGYDNEFSEKLTLIVNIYGPEAMDTICYLVLSGKIDAQIVSETLRILGMMKEYKSRAWRFWLLQKSLSSPSFKIRDGALMGLSFMDDPAAIDELKVARENEEISELREDIGKVIAQLENTLSCQDS